MAKFKLKKKLSQRKTGWKENIIDQINAGKALPFISNVVSNNLVFENHDELVKSWVEYIEYPLSEPEQVFRKLLATLPNKDENWERYLDMAFQKNLSATAQYQRIISQSQADIDLGIDFIKKTYLDFLQELLFSIADEELVADIQADTRFNSLSFSEIAQRLNYPPLADDDQNPLMLLAALPLPIYVTTSYHSFMEMALRLEGKRPRTEICYWGDHLNRIPSVFDDKSYQPSPEEPLVYHLHGIDEHPNSLVLTEDDHLDFLITISKEKGTVPLPVRQALADSSLILLGYGVRQWDFYVVFRGLIKPAYNQRRPTSISIQLINQGETDYLKSYLKLEARFGVYWGNTRKFMQELWSSWIDQE